MNLIPPCVAPACPKMPPIAVEAPRPRGTAGAVDAAAAAVARMEAVSLGSSRERCGNVG